MNPVFRRRLVGLLALIGVLFVMTWIVPKGWNGQGGTTPSVVVPLSQDTNPASLPAASSGSADNPESAPTITTESEREPSPAAVETPHPRLVESIGTVAATHATATRSAPSKPGSAVKPTNSVPASSSSGKHDKPKAPPVALVMIPSVHAPVVPASAPVPSTTAKTPTAAKPTLSTGSGWYVQVGSYADREKAETTVSLMSNIGYHGEISPISSAAGLKLFRVRLGPYLDENAGRAVREKVARQGYPDSRLVPVNR